MMDEGEHDFRRTPRQRQTWGGMDRLPPHSMEAEQGTLGCILIDPRRSMPVCIERIKEAAIFYDLRHQTVYCHAEAMFKGGKPIDLITLTESLKLGQALEQVGGLGFLSGLPDTTPSALNLEYYLDILVDKYTLRTLVETYTQSVARVYEYEGAVDELMDEVERDVLKIRAHRVVNKVKDTRELVRMSIETIEQLHQRQGHLIGLSSGFVDYDKLTGGLKAAEFVIFAGRPSMGKTSLAMNIAEHVAIEQRLPVGVFSLEMTAEALMLRALCSRARVNLRSVAEGFLAERDLPKLTGAAGKLSSAPLHIDDSSSMTILQLRAKAMRMYQEHGIKLFVVDYLQLLHGGKQRRRDPSRQEEISEISEGLKNLAKDLNVPVIVTSQLNREIEREKHNRKPRMSDLRESGALEQDGDTIGFLYAPRNEDGSGDDEVWDDAEAINLLIGKQRNGPRDKDVRLTFLKAFTRFESAARVCAVEGDEQERLC